MQEVCLRGEEVSPRFQDPMLTQLVAQRPCCLEQSWVVLLLAVAVVLGLKLNSGHYEFMVTSSWLWIYI